MQAYSDPTRESDAHALPDIEVFHVDTEECFDSDTWMYERLCDAMLEAGIQETPDVDNPVHQAEALATVAGWYWWSCFPGCMPDSDAIGPFDSEAEALADVREQ